MKQIIKEYINHPLGGMLIMLFGVFYLFRTLKKRDEIRDIWSPIQPYMSAIVGSIGLIIAGIIVLTMWIKNV